MLKRKYAIILAAPLLFACLQTSAQAGRQTVARLPGLSGRPLGRSLHLEAPVLSKLGRSRSVASEEDLTTGMRPVPATGGLQLTRSEERELSLPKDHPALQKYFHLLHELHKAWGEPPFERAELVQAQRDAADAVGLKLEVHKTLLEVAPQGGHWMNRWTAGLQKSMRLRLYWSPLHNHFSGSGGSFNDQGWIMSDALGPVMRGPSPALQHELLHAYVARGKHRGSFEPLRTRFSTTRGRFPRSEDTDSFYARQPAFGADEILANLHTVFDHARRMGASYAADESPAPPDVKGLIHYMATPIFLIDSVKTMTKDLLAPINKIIGPDKPQIAFKKEYRRFNGSIPMVGEIEENEEKDLGYFEMADNDVLPRFSVRYLTFNLLEQTNPDGRPLFPVLFSKDGYAAQVEFDLFKTKKYDISEPSFQNALVMLSAPLMAKNLTILSELTQSLTPANERLKHLFQRAKQNLNMGLVREIHTAARAAFLQTTQFFIKQPLR